MRLGVVLVLVVGLALVAAAMLWGRLPEPAAPAAGRPLPPARGVLLPRVGQGLGGGAKDAGADAGALAGPCDTDDACDSGTCCGGACVDERSDARHCGACGEPCALGVACLDGDCAAECDTSECPGGFLCTQSGRCVRTRCDEGTDELSCARGAEALGLCCATACVDTLSSHSHCGACGTSCGPGEFCNEGVCAPNVECSTADAGEVSCACSLDRIGACCAGRCADTGREPGNCGACGRVCAAGEVCADGECAVVACEGIPSDQACLVPDGGKGFCCDGACRSARSFRSDPQNCGACRAHCPTQAACSEGSCEEPDSGRTLRCHSGECAPDEVCMPDGICLRQGCGGLHDNLPCAQSPDMEGVCCGGVCTDVTQDPGSCGRCGRRCDAGELCDEALCKAFSGCDAPGATVCPLSAATNGICCGTTCVDSTSDGKNCGACGNACPANRTCDHGSCRAVTCDRVAAGEPCEHPSGEASECCHGRCVPVESFDGDPANCGDCGLTCASGDRCELGSCSSPDSGLPVDCTSQGCPPGQACVEGERCVPTACAASEDGMKCAAPTGLMGSCCGGRCVELRLDPLDCGSCGNACGGDQFCNLGSCEVFGGCDGGGACPLPGSRVGICCEASCVDVERDAKNCGGCGQACEAGAGCVSFRCQGAIKN